MSKRESRIKNQGFFLKYGKLHAPKPLANLIWQKGFMRKILRHLLNSGDGKKSLR